MFSHFFVNFFALFFPFLFFLFFSHSPFLPFEGFFATHPGVNEPALVFITYEDRVHLYYDVKLSSVGFKTLVSEMAQDISKFPSELQPLFAQDPSRRGHTSPALTKFLHSVMYDTAAVENLEEMRDKLAKEKENKEKL